MVFEKPLIDKRELLRALDPVYGRGGPAYGRLQRAQLLSSGLRAGNPASQRNGVSLYCSLNRDAVSAVRQGHQELAREMRDHAQRIEEDVLSPWLSLISESWSDLPERSDDDAPSPTNWIDRVLFTAPANGSPVVAEPVLEAAAEVAKVRTRYGNEQLRTRLTIGRVWRIDDHLCEVRPESAVGESFVFATDEVLDAGLRLGDPIVIRHEELGPGVLLTTLERGLESRTRVSRLSGQAMPEHLEALLAESLLPTRTIEVRPLRRVA